MALRKLFTNKAKGTLLTFAVVSSTITETYGQELKGLNISEETKEKYQMYQDRVNEVDINDDVAIELSMIVGRVPFTLPVSCIQTNRIMNLMMIEHNQLLIIEEGQNSVGIEHDGIVVDVKVEGVESCSKESSKFTDVGWDRWSYNYITAAVGKGLMEGVGDSKFNPSAKLDTATALTGLNRVMMNNFDFEMKNSRFIIEDLFQETDNNHWAYKHILNIASKLDGEDVLMYASLENKIFNEKVTRDMMARLAFELFSDKGFYTSNTNILFTDVTGDPSAIEFVASTGIMIGDGTNEFRPDDMVTREELASILVRIDDLYRSR